MWDPILIYVTEQVLKSVGQIKFLSSKICGLTTWYALLYCLFINYLITFWLFWESPSPLPTHKQTVIFKFIFFTTSWPPPVTVLHVMWIPSSYPGYSWIVFYLFSFSKFCQNFFVPFTCQLNWFSFDPIWKDSNLS